MTFMHKMKRKILSKDTLKIKQRLSANLFYLHFLHQYDTKVRNAFFIIFCKTLFTHHYFVKAFMKSFDFFVIVIHRYQKKKLSSVISPKAWLRCPSPTCFISSACSWIESEKVDSKWRINDASGKTIVTPLLWG